MDFLQRQAWLEGSASMRRGVTRKGKPGVLKKNEAGVSKRCCLEVFKHLRASKKHSFVTPGR